MNPGPSSRLFVVAEEHIGERLDAALTAWVQGDLSRSQLARQIGAGALTINGQPCVSPSQKLRAGDTVIWTPPAAVPAPHLQAEDIALTVVYEDRDLIVIDKPAGLVVHPAAGHQGGTLVNALLSHCKDLRGVGGELRPGIVHRLDKDTSGLMVVAKDDNTMAALGAAFKVHDIERVYEAVVVGRPKGTKGRIESLHGRDRHHRKRFTTQVNAGKTAITNWRLLESIGGVARMEARLETGRTHQVRVHFAAMGCPILGDATYGRAARDLVVREVARTLGRQALHARVLGFKHPGTGEALRFQSEPPADFAAALLALRALAEAAEARKR